MTKPRDQRLLAEKRATNRREGDMWKDLPLSWAEWFFMQSVRERSPYLLFSQISGEDISDG